MTKKEVRLFVLQKKFFLHLNDVDVIINVEYQGLFITIE